jgi:hypothetical protein
MKTIIAHLQKYYGIYLLIIAVLFMILWSQNKAVNRYAISGNLQNGGIILDTRTGQTWGRAMGTLYDFGTTDEPRFEKVLSIEEKIRNLEKSLERQLEEKILSPEELLEKEKIK